MIGGVDHHFRDGLAGIEVDGDLVAHFVGGAHEVGELLMGVGAVRQPETGRGQAENGFTHALGPIGQAVGQCRLGAGDARVDAGRGLAAVHIFIGAFE